MLGLLGNVFHYCVAIGNAHGECAVTRLPRKIVHAHGLVNPHRRGLMSCTNGASECVARKPTRNSRAVSEPKYWRARRQKRQAKKSQRDFVLQPRVASSELPWVNREKWFSTATRLWPNFIRAVRNGHNRVAVGNIGGRCPRVASQARQPWALGRNPFGIRIGRAPGAPGRRRSRGGFFLIKF
jgi:hypothetical protein